MYSKQSNHYTKHVIISSVIINNEIWTNHFTPIILHLFYFFDIRMIQILF